MYNEGTTTINFHSPAHGKTPLPRRCEFQRLDHKGIEYFWIKYLNAILKIQSFDTKTIEDYVWGFLDTFDCNCMLLAVLSSSAL